MDKYWDDFREELRRMEQKHNRRFQQEEQAWEKEKRRFEQQAGKFGSGKNLEVERAMSLLEIKNTQDLTQKTLRKAYLAAARKYHPDADPAHKTGAKFKEAARAYEILRQQL
jgi:hypothetical protein